MKYKKLVQPFWSPTTFETSETIREDNLPAFLFIGWLSGRRSEMHI